MAPNKFAKIHQKNTNRTIFLLKYTALEWILIILLLLNALFSYMISKFASFFGLKPPCIFCSRIDHIFVPKKSNNSCGDFLCESHAREVSKLGFCSNHRRLADSGDMCEDCAASKPAETDRSFALLSWMKRSEQGEKDLKCSCCGVGLESGFYSPYLRLKTESWNVLEFFPREKLDKNDCFGLEETGQDKDQGFVSSSDVVVDALFPRVEEMGDLERILPNKKNEETLVVSSSEMRETEEDSFAVVATEEPSDIGVVEFEDQKVSVSEEDGKGNEDARCEISIGSEICDEEQIEPAAIDHQNPNVLIETTPNDPGTETEPSENTFKISPVLNEIEEERIMPETPTTPNCIYNNFPLLHKRFLLERRESGNDSLDGSIASDIDNLDPPNIDHLKATLKSERKTLFSLYAELEEERSASAIAANQTMAMITRLQEEKAAMQMEALQYQRLMEEQSNYDQDALHLLNELMLKREKEKQELKTELEFYRRKVRVYEAIERREIGMGSASGTSSSAEENEEISVEDVKNLITMDESLDEFEEERVAILEQLKALEEMLFTINSQHMKQFPNQNGHVNGSSYCLGENECELGFDRVYEKLRALEADGEFLKNCLSSLEKGGRGMELLREILQHLRDLRASELSSKH